MLGHAWWRSGLSHLVDLLVALPKDLCTFPVGAVSGEVTMLLACKARSVVERILVWWWLVGCFRFPLTWERLYQHRRRSWVLRRCRVVNLWRHHMGLMNLSWLQLLQRLTVLIVRHEWCFLSIRATCLQLLLCGKSDLFHSRWVFQVVFVCIHG